MLGQERQGNSLSQFPERLARKEPSEGHAFSSTNLAVVLRTGRNAVTTQAVLPQANPALLEQA